MEQTDRIETHCTKCKNAQNVALQIYNRFCERALKNGIKKRATLKCECGGQYMAIEKCPHCNGLGQVSIIVIEPIKTPMAEPKYKKCWKCSGKGYIFKEPDDATT